MLSGRWNSLEETAVRAMFETDFGSTANMTRESVRFMRDINQAGVGGRTLQISSASGVQGVIVTGHYSATTFASVDGLSEAFAAKLDPTCSIVSPGTSAISAVRWPPSHPAYETSTAPTAGLRRVLEKYVPFGDPRKDTETVHKLASLEDPPMHFPLGKDAMGIYRGKATQILGAVDKYALWSDEFEKSPRSVGPHCLPRGDRKRSTFE
ncbi:hypothetical protein C8Q80DRAFT_217044 [Daedaleopsis nitida]|nr:hypothetical protein C8Q80DRAFT_217044 [Daedaleopsis nitida]